MRAPRGGGVVALLGALSGGCQTWSWPDVDTATVAVSPAAPCGELARAADERGWELFVSDGEVNSHTQVLADDELLLLDGRVEVIRRGGWLTLRRRRAHEVQVELRCPPLWEPLALPVRRCAAERRWRWVVDPRPLQGLVARGTPDQPCRWDVALRVGQRWSVRRGRVIVRRSPRAVIEGVE